MLKLAVIGKDVSQSDSPAIHNFILHRFSVECSYEKVSIPPEEFDRRAEELFSRYDGFNVTIPFKGEIIRYLNALKGDAEVFGAVNTVVTGERLGYNTDGYGFMLMLENAGLDVKDKAVLVLGAGGAGRSCIKKLTDAGAEVYAYERDGARLKAVYEELGGFIPLKQVPVRPFDIILNCTGIGMHNTVGMLPSVAYESGETDTADRLLKLCGAAVDLIYVPPQSQFLRVAEAYGKTTLNGAAMLFYQAYFADCIFLNRDPNSEEAKTLWKEYSEVKK